MYIIIYFPRFHSTRLLIKSDKRKGDPFPVCAPRIFPERLHRAAHCSWRRVERPRPARSPHPTVTSASGRWGPLVAPHPPPPARRTLATPASPGARPSQHSPVTRMDSSIVPPRPRAASWLHGHGGRGPAGTGQPASSLWPGPQRWVAAEGCSPRLEAG